MTMAFVVKDQNGGTTSWSRARKDAIWPGVVLAVVTTVVILATVVLPDGSRSFAFCGAETSVEAGPCEVNFLNLLLVGGLMTAVLIPVWIALSFLAIAVVRKYIGEPLPPLAQPRAMAETISRVTGARVVETEGGILPAAPVRRSARARRARIDVVRAVMTMLGMSRAAILAMDEAERSAAFAAAEHNDAATTSSDVDWSATATGNADVAGATSDAIVARVEATAGEGDRDFLPPNVVETDTTPSEPSAPAAGSAFVAPVVATVDGGLIDLNRRINGTLATRTANVVVLADVRAQREGGDAASQPADPAGQGTPPPATPAVEPAADALSATPDAAQSVDRPAAAIDAVETIAAPLSTPPTDVEAAVSVDSAEVESSVDALVADEALAAEVARVVEAEPPHAPVDEPVDVEVQAFRDLIDGIDNPAQYLPLAEPSLPKPGPALELVASAEVVSLEDAASGYLQRRPAREAEVAAS